MELNVDIQSWGAGRSDDLDHLKGGKKCSICGKLYTGFGNNARPVNDGRCCDKCNWEVVVPRRLQYAKEGKGWNV